MLVKEAEKNMDKSQQVTLFPGPPTPTPPHHTNQEAQLPAYTTQGMHGHSN